MRVNAALVLRARNARAWSQEELAIASGLNLRTIQRVEREAVASLRSKKALAAALDIDTSDLDYEEIAMKRCPDCDSTNRYAYTGHVDMTTIGGDLIPKLGGILRSAKVRPVVCADCGLLAWYAGTEVIEKLRTSKHWELL